MVRFSTQPKLFGGCSMSKLLQNSGTHLPQLMNTNGFHQNVGEGNKSLNAMSPGPLLSEAFGKGSGCARLSSYSKCHTLHWHSKMCEQCSRNCVINAKLKEIVSSDGGCWLWW